eukprot:c8570_g1_i1 orf=83-454(+)
MASSAVLLMVLLCLLLAPAPQCHLAQADPSDAKNQLIPAAAPHSPPAPPSPEAPVPAPAGPLNCTSACAFRCSKAGRPNVCERACGTCCDRCKCVPPGTSGNQEVCGICYTGQTTHENKTKCP